MKVQLSSEQKDLLKNNDVSGFFDRCEYEGWGMEVEYSLPFKKFKNEIEEIGNILMSNHLVIQSITDMKMGGGLTKITFTIYGRKHTVTLKPHYTFAQIKNIYNYEQ